MSATQPFFLNYGFFLYLTKDDSSCSRMVVPRIAHVPHANFLLVPEASTVIADPQRRLPVTRPNFCDPFGDHLAINMQGLSVSINAEAPARLGRRSGTSIDEPDFDWIPKLQETVCNVALHRAWRRSAAVNSVIELGGGELLAVADAFTCDRIWTWQHCDGQHRERRVTTMTLYDPQAAEVGLTFRTTPDGAPFAHATMTPGEAPALYISVPEELLSLCEDPGQEIVEAAHVGAIIGLCERNGDIRVPQRQPTHTKCMSADGPHFRLFSLFRKMAVRHNGTIECSGQQDPDPNP